MTNIKEDSKCYQMRALEKSIEPNLRHEEFMAKGLKRPPKDFNSDSFEGFPNLCLPGIIQENDAKINLIEQKDEFEKSLLALALQKEILEKTETKNIECLESKINFPREVS